jgi:hypothetical protein
LLDNNRGTSHMIIRRHILLLSLPSLVVLGAVGLPIFSRTAIANECCLDMSRPACGKVCKLVCEQKKLAAVGYGSKCKAICLPEPSCPGYKHCAVCCPNPNADDKPGNCCPNCRPKFEFSWRDWFACGCAKPRTIHVLTKYQAEKKIPWYHWDVVDAPCCEGAEPIEKEATPEKKSVKQAGRTIYKPAPADAQVGDTLALTDQECVSLAVVLAADSAERESGAVAEASSERPR